MKHEFAWSSEGLQNVLNDWSVKFKTSTIENETGEKGKHQAMGALRAVIKFGLYLRGSGTAWRKLNPGQLGRSPLPRDKSGRAMWFRHTQLNRRRGSVRRCGCKNILIL